MDDFRKIQMETGWGRTLQAFLEWCKPQPGWRTLDVGCGPGLLPALLARQGCRAFGVDLSLEAVLPSPFHPDICLGDPYRLPFASHAFHQVTASNLLFLLDDPLAALQEMARLIQAGGQVCLLNPSERMSVEAAGDLARRSGLEGIAAESLINWARRAELHYRWTEVDMQQLYTAAGLNLVESELRVGPGLARFSRGFLYGNKDNSVGRS